MIEVNTWFYGCFYDLNLTGTQTKAVVIKKLTAFAYQIPKGKVSAERKIFMRVMIFCTPLRIDQSQKVVSIGF